MNDADGFITFSKEQPEQRTFSGEPWKILVIDDDRSVHDVTAMILKNVVFENRALELLNAYNEQQAYDILAGHRDLAVILLDVVMDTEESGLAIVKYIRDVQHNKISRIILRTGQPGHAPEKRVIIDYDINDYKLKTELTADRLFVTMISALRSYNDLIILEMNRKGLERIIDSSASLFRHQSFRDFVSGVLLQLTAIMHLDKSALYCRTSGLSALKKDDHFVIEAAIGDFTNVINRSIEEVLSSGQLELVDQALREKRSVYRPDSFIAYFESANGPENIIYITCSREISKWDKQLIELFCTNISVGLDNISLGQEIENTQKEIIETLGEVAEARSRETGHHVKRVAEFSKILAIHCGFGEEEAEILRMAAPMHDIGKLAIPDAILNKPEALTEEERAIIRTHTQAGYDMLKNSNRPIMRVAATIALEHHEKYDGTGYPLGLAANKISIYGRIVAIADVYDALGCDRVYKKAWQHNAILNFFLQEKGRYFDPELVDIFIDSIDTIVAIKKSFPD